MREDMTQRRKEAEDKGKDQTTSDGGLGLFLDGYFNFSFRFFNLAMRALGKRFPPEKIDLRSPLHDKTKRS